MSQFYFSLGFLSQNSLWKLFTFHGYKGIYSRVHEEFEKTFFCKIGCSGDSPTTKMSREFELRDNYQARLSFLSYGAPAVVTFQLLACFTRVAFWWVASRESLARSSHENPLECTHIWIHHTLSHITLTWFSPKYRVSNCWNTNKYGTR